MVSICSLTYNHENFLRDAMDGFLMQRVKFPVEIIIHDDASTDRTPAIIREYAQKHPGIIRPIFQAENQFSKRGIYPIVNCYRAAAGKYIATCDGDDYWTDPEKLQKQVDFLEANPGYSSCYHAREVVRDGIVRRYNEDAPRDFTAEDLIAYDNVRNSREYGIHSGTRMMRNLYSAETADEFEKYRHFDYLESVYLGFFGGCKFLPDIKPTIYRRHAGNSWSGHSWTRAKMKDIQMQAVKMAEEKGTPAHVAIRRAICG